MKTLCKCVVCLCFCVHLCVSMRVSLHVSPSACVSVWASLCVFVIASGECACCSNVCALGVRVRALRLYARPEHMHTQPASKGACRSWCHAFHFVCKLRGVRV